MVGGLIGCTVAALSTLWIIDKGVDALVKWNRKYLRARGEVFSRTLRESKTWGEWFERLDSGVARLDEEYKGKWWYRRHR